ncbi:hypothetical protein VTK73DRAFT_2816 [Phialemonium thermophilum]|uniref:Auxin efflux carrier n=1 Tax=Phialemonium thermophilum TaxID=223376 RepID=A0ABR3X2S2_9PEZI
MGFPGFNAPVSFRRVAMSQGFEPLDPVASSSMSPFIVFAKQPHESHPSFGGLVLLVFEAVMEVVCVSLPGYVIARLGHFDADKQKFLANLNVMLFTPCLIFTKLASQLNADKLVELGIIPIIFAIQTLVSYAVSRIVARCFGLNRRATNFVTAMGVFGNSNSLPISLVISLSQTLKGLHWDRIPGDNDDEVAARGILYLLIFQQLGQLVRWSWGYHVLLAPKHKYEEYRDELTEEGQVSGDDSRDEEAENRHGSVDHSGAVADEHMAGRHHRRIGTGSDYSEVYDPAGRTPVAGTSTGSPSDTESEGGEERRRRKLADGKTHFDGTTTVSIYRDDTSDSGAEHMLSFPPIRSREDPEVPPGLKGGVVRIRRAARRLSDRVWDHVVAVGRRVFARLPGPVQRALTVAGNACQRAYVFLEDFMNPPLWAMLIALLVASVPDLQQLFFREGSFIKNSVTSAVTQTGGVAVPLILVVLGANLARNTQKQDDADPEEKEIGTRLVVASLISRMLLPTLVMAPILALFAKYVPISILDDPIFVIVCFLLTGAPSALQLAQICQINGVYENKMSQILFQSYVVWILPSTLILVLCALEVVEWAK